MAFLKNKFASEAMKMITLKMSVVFQVATLQMLFYSKIFTFAGTHLSGSRFKSRKQ